VTGTLDTNVQAPPASEKVAADVAVKEISALLREVPSTQPQCPDTAKLRARPKLGGLTGAPAPVELVPPLGIWLLPRPCFQVTALTPGLAGGGPHLFTLAGSAVPLMRPTPPMTLLPTSGPAVESRMVVHYRMATPPSGIEVSCAALVQASGLGGVGGSCQLDCPSCHPVRLVEGQSGDHPSSG